MSIGVKVVERPIEQTSYVRATLTGMAHTLKHLFTPEKVTTQYPEQKESISKRWRGTHRMSLRATRLSAGGSWPGTYLPDSTPRAIGEYGTTPIP